MSYTEQVLAASNAQSSDEFGISVALSRDASVAVIGAWGVAAGASSGAVYVYSGTGYATETELIPGDLSDGAEFGVAVAVSEDGSVIAVSRAWDAAYDGIGCAYIFSGPSWATVARVDLTVAYAALQVGSIALSSDGSILAVGAMGFDPLAIAGEVHLFSGAAYGTETIVAASDSIPGEADYFGVGIPFANVLALSASGTILAVGAPNHGGGAGQAYAYSGALWAVETILASPAPAVTEFYGGSVSLSSSGAVLAVGAPRNTLTEGHAYVYSGAAYATLAATLTASDGEIGNRFGAAVAIQSDGSAVLVGATDAHRLADNAGRAYLYTGASFGTELEIAPGDGESDGGGNFGNSVSIADDATLLVGAHYATTGSDGEAYLYLPPAPPPSIVVYARVYGIDISLSDDGVEQVSRLVTSPDGF